MNSRLLITLATVLALAAPVGATAKLIPIKHPAAKNVAKHVVKRHVTPRVLCICGPATFIGLPLSEAQLEAQIDADMISHGLDPLYGLTPANLALELQYDAALVANGLNPVFGVVGMRPAQ